MLGAAFYQMAVIYVAWGLILCGNLECYIFNTYLVFLYITIWLIDGVFFDRLSNNLP